MRIEKYVDDITGRDIVERVVVTVERTGYMISSDGHTFVSSYVVDVELGSDMSWINSLIFHKGMVTGRSSDIQVGKPIDPIDAKLMYNEGFAPLRPGVYDQS